MPGLTLRQKVVTEAERRARLQAELPWQIERCPGGRMTMAELRQWLRVINIAVGEKYLMQVLSSQYGAVRGRHTIGGRRIVVLDGIAWRSSAPSAEAIAAAVTKAPVDAALGLHFLAEDWTKFPSWHREVVRIHVEHGVSSLAMKQAIQLHRARAGIRPGD